MLTKKDESIILDNTDEAFVGTPLASEAFMIEITKLKRADNINLLHSSTDEDGNIKQGTYSKNLFIASITSADGFVDENQVPIGVEDGVAEIIWEYSPDVLVNAIKVKFQSFTAIDEKKSETPENDSETTPVGA